jgi:hypothetical protein
VVIVNELLPHQPSKLPHYMGVETQWWEPLWEDLKVPPN